MQRHLLVAELVLFGDELALLVLQPGDVVGRLRDLRGEREVEQDADQSDAERQVSVCVGVQLQALGGNRARHLHESARAPTPACRCVLGGRGAKPAPGEYSGRCQVLCLMCCWV